MTGSHDRRILILTSSHLCRNPRVLKEAATLGAAGYDVTVMSVSTLARFERTDLELMAGQPFKRTVIDYTRSNAATRLRRLLSRGTTRLAREILQRGGIESAAALGPAAALLRKARGVAAELTIAHTEIPLWAAKTLVDDGRRVAVDLEDWYSEDLLEVDRASRPLQLLRQAESFALRRAGYTSVPSASMGDALVATYGGAQPVVVRNVFPLPAGFRSIASGDSALPAFVWFSQTIGPGRGLEFFFAAWAAMKTPTRVFLIGDIRDGYLENLLVPVAVDRRSQVHVIPFVAPNDLPPKLAEFDIGLALEPRLPRNRDLTITNKIFQYLGAGLAVVATATAGQTEVMRAAPECGLLTSTGTPEQLAAELDALAGNRDRLHRCQRAARLAAEREFCWERESPRLLDAVARALAAPPAGS
jgi:glycosyltransferase involved in cell wall biosynthesis